jgi:hypothetical protein
MADGDEVVYGIDAQDRVVFVNAAWDEYAAENGAPGLSAGGVISRSLWDFIADDTTRQLYREIIMRARAGRRPRFPFRCDSPDCRRYLEIDARLLEDRCVGFRVRTLALEQRTPQPLLDESRPRSQAVLRMCSWCKRIPYEGRWIEVEEAAEKLGLFESARLPMLSHGICEECDRRISNLDDGAGGPVSEETPPPEAGPEPTAG